MSTEPKTAPAPKKPTPPATAPTKPVEPTKPKAPATEPAKEPAKPVKKTKCPMTLEEFLATAKPLRVTIEMPDGTIEKRVLGVKEFSTGSFGWYFSEKVIFTLGGVEMKLQAAFSLPIVGSKDQ